MSAKTLVMIGLTLGSLIGGYIPTFLGDSMFSMWSLIGSTVGGLIGIYVGYRLSSS